MPTYYKCVTILQNICILLYNKSARTHIPNGLYTVPPPSPKISLSQSQEHFRNLKQNIVILLELLITLILHPILCSVTINHWKRVYNFHYSNRSKILTRMYWVTGIIIIFSSLFKITQIFLAWPHHERTEITPLPRLW